MRAAGGLATIVSVIALLLGAVIETSGDERVVYDGHLDLAE